MLHGRKDRGHKYDQATGEPLSHIARWYVDPAIYFGRRLEILESWGPRIRPHESVLEIGCGDGYLAGLLVDKQCRVCASDVSPALVEATRNRNQASIESGALSTRQLDINQIPFPVGETFDHVVAVMRHLYKYADQPRATLQELYRVSRRKMIADFDPRMVSAKSVIADLASVGFRNIRVRAFLTPQKRSLPKLVRRTLAACEQRPWVYRNLLRRYRFQLWVLGEK